MQVRPARRFHLVFPAESRVNYSCIPLLVGGMCEWLKQAVLKTAVRETVPGVRIPLPPPLLLFSWG